MRWIARRKRKMKLRDWLLVFGLALLAPNAQAKTFLSDEATIESMGQGYQRLPADLEQKSVQDLKIEMRPFNPETSPWFKQNHYLKLRTQDYEWNYLEFFAKQANAQKLVLLHGGGTWSYSFRYLILQLQDRYDLLVLDLPGFGLSRPMDEHFRNYSMSSFVKNLRQFLDAKKVDRFTFVGHSWGGGLALGYAEKFPEQVQKLILLSSSGLDIPDIWEWELFKIKWLGHLFTYFITPATVRLDLKKAFFNHQLISDEMVGEVYWPLRQRFVKRAIYFYSQNFDWLKVEQGLSRLKQKALLLWGANDHYISVQDAKRLKAKLKNSRLLVFPRCGHQIHEECVAQISPEIEKFLLQAN